MNMRGTLILFLVLLFLGCIGSSNSSKEVSTRNLCDKISEVDSQIAWYYDANTKIDVIELDSYLEYLKNKLENNENVEEYEWNILKNKIGEYNIVVSSDNLFKGFKKGSKQICPSGASSDSSGWTCGREGACDRVLYYSDYNKPYCRYDNHAHELYRSDIWNLDDAIEYANYGDFVEAKASLVEAVCCNVKPYSEIDIYLVERCLLFNVCDLTEYELYAGIYPTYFENGRVIKFYDSSGGDLFFYFYNETESSLEVKLLNFINGGNFEFLKETEGARGIRITDYRYFPPNGTLREVERENYGDVEVVRYIYKVEEDVWYFTSFESCGRVFGYYEVDKWNRRSFEGFMERLFS